MYVERWGRRWPVVAGIPFLRRGREALADRALAHLEAGDERGALIELLGDQDDWWPFALPDQRGRARALETASLRAAMDALGYGPVGDYFAYRWSDPTFLSGLALLERHGEAHGSLFELGCGVGHFLRELHLRGVEVGGGDVVFSKLWLARRFLVPEAHLVCFDARYPFPLQAGGYDVAFCHDALHYLPDKLLAVAELRRIARCVLIGHAHNRLVANLSAGSPLAPAAYAELLPGAVMYDDAELAGAAREAHAPRPGENLDCAAAIALAWPPEQRRGPSLTRARPRARLRLNPLLDPDSLELRWPSERYREEYEALSSHLRGVDRSAGEDELYRRRVLLDLPEAW